MSSDKPSATEMSARDLRVAIVAARFNQGIVDRLVSGAREALLQAGAPADSIEEFRCPGSLEIPGLARRIARTGRFDALICIGVVIRGETLHFELVAHNAVGGIANLSNEGDVAVANCILACNNPQEAHDRAGGKDGNRGHDAAQVAIEMAHHFRQLVTR